MANDLVPARESSLARAAAAAADFIAAAQADNTRRAYAADWRDFEGWCQVHGLAPLPALPATVAAYLAARASAGSARVSTLRRRVSAIADAHRREGYASPTAPGTVQQTFRGIARTLGSAPTKKAALTAELVAKCIRRIPVDLEGLRDRALILIGFAGTFRRSELVALDLEDVERRPQGIVLRLRRSKTDQAGEGRIKAIPAGKRLRPVAALDAWLAAARITEGPIFRPIARSGHVGPGRLCDRQVARIVKKRARAAGLDPKLFAGHSLRSGFLTTAGEHGADLRRAADHAHHAKLDTTRGYMQISDAFKDHAGAKFL